MINKVYYSFDLEELGFLPTKWSEEIHRVSEEYAQHVFLDGKSSSSREPENSKGVDYFVVAGDVIFEKLGWLYRLYASKLVVLAATVAQETILVSPDVASAININVLNGVGARYEWHVDTNPLTALLFVTTHSEDDGGELVFRLPEQDIIVHPKAGTLLLFDARNIPHTVMPLKYPHKRISIPMNYYTIDQTIEKVRPEDLDKYIYSSS